MSGLEARDLSCGYAARAVLNQLSLAAEAGQVLALLGPNGAGKTTLLKALGRLLQPSVGHVLFQGRDIWKESALEAARHTAYTPQNEASDLPLAIEEAVLLGRSPHRGWLVPFTSEDHRIAEAAIERMHLGALRQRPITQLSGGEWRRVMLARALAQQPRALLLDEPTAQLDMKHQMEILSHLRTLARSDGLVIIVTLHDLNQAAQFADRLALLHDAGLAACGTAAEVLTEEILSRTYGLPIQVVRHPLYDIPFVIPLVTEGVGAYKAI